MREAGRFGRASDSTGVSGASTESELTSVIVDATAPEFAKGIPSIHIRSGPHNTHVRIHPATGPVMKVLESLTLRCPPCVQSLMLNNTAQI